MFYVYIFLKCMKLLYIQIWINEIVSRGLINLLSIVLVLLEQLILYFSYTNTCFGENPI